MSQLKIFRASAGSGKTYTLTGEYIHLLIKNPSDYHKVLAVTFTNKATAEMRIRILENLYNLSNNLNKNPDHLTELMQNHELTEKQVRTRAALILRFLLHDYSRFSVSTIDSFFQSIVRSFAKEMGLPIGFRLELQPNQIMTQAIDRVILEMDQPGQADLKKWLIEFAETKMEQDKGWNITQEIRQISEAIYSEVFQENAVALWKELNSKEQLYNYRQALRQIVTQTDKQIQEIGKAAIEIIKQNNLNISEDFFRKSTTPVKVFLKMESLATFSESNGYEFLIDDVDRWMRKDNSTAKNSAIADAFHDGLNQKLKDAQDLLKTVGKDYFTATAILENLNALGIVTDVSQKMAELCRERNLFLISGTNHLLSRIIDNNDTPFIYEKTGTRYSHFMIDEFQDTSSLQYLNFKPLINESLASKNSTLLVGDVKQAIYRWRNSDWNLLAEQVEQDFTGFGKEPKSLDVNWRSLEEVIQFNNLFFSKAPRILQDNFNELIPEEIKEDLAVKVMSQKITGAYDDVVQKVSPDKKESGGSVYVKFLEGSKKDTDVEMTLKVVERVCHLMEKGSKLSDICILVRTNKDGIILTNALLSGLFHPTKETIPVISSESLLLNGSEAIKLIINQLRFLQDPGDQITESYIRLTWVKNSLTNLSPVYDASQAFETSNDNGWHKYRSELITLQEKPLYELTESMVRFLPPSLHKNHGVYIQSFMSLLLGFINDETADLNAFLEYWDKNCEKFSLSVPENQQAVKVMTIHKSKGLEFKSVIIPFFSWELLSKRQRNLLWIKPEHAPFNQLSLVPVSFKKELLLSHFSEEYLFETLQQYIDNLNLSYVAFTRARENLSVFGIIKNKELKNIQTAADLLYYFMLNNADKSYWDDELNEYNKEITPKYQEKKEKETIRPQISVDLNQLNSSPFRGKVMMHLESEGYFHEDAQVTKIDYGRIMHQLFESIIVLDDVEPSLKAMRYKGRITQDELLVLKKQAMEWLSDVRVKKWFDGSFEVKTEIGILWKEQKRPDRVMIAKDQVVVVDYKFGNQKTNTHLDQIRGYVKLIHQMGYKSVKAYLWYVLLGEITEVTQQGRLFD
jgi:ATP-dependent exoDNAse (exonuclease V) beta subunit